MISKFLHKLKSLLSIQRKIFFEEKYYETYLENIIEDEVYNIKFGRISINLPDKSFVINTQGTAYIDINKYNLILTTADGDFYTSKVEKEVNNSIKLKNIESNITTLIAAVILFFMGSGPIKGFSITLGIGIFTTLFSVYFIARLLTALYVTKNKHKENLI